MTNITAIDVAKWMIKSGLYGKSQTYLEKFLFMKKKIEIYQLQRMF